MKKLPIGIQTFSKIREGDYLYIDKTDIALSVIEENNYLFLSRPRRFGKSLFLDTLHNIFEAKKELFEGLYIYDKYDWSISYPVIKISFAEGALHSRESLDNKIIVNLRFNQERLGVECIDTKNVSICFEELISEVYKKYNQKVIILIDEYDKPLLDNITDLEIAKDMRDGLRNFYSVIKGYDKYIKFAFLTGVSKFSKVSIFSGLNNLRDISLVSEYGNICGYTQNDIETSFLPYLDGVDMVRLKSWYNGYNFLKDDVYNPFDILLFIKNGYLYKNYWFETGTPNFLIEVIKKEDYFLPNLLDIQVGEDMINSFDIEDIKLESLLFQTGYLTIDKVVEKARGGFGYYLKTPNIEVTLSLNNILINYLTNQNSQKIRIQDNIYSSLISANLEEFRETLTTLFASIPYNNYVKNNISNYEGYFASVIYVYLASLGFEMIAEDVTNRGRIDLTIKIRETIYIIEFKVGKEDALSQIKSKNYAQKYLNDNKTIYLVGINFDEEQKNISAFEWEKIWS